jgi:hypothetical protein
MMRGQVPSSMHHAEGQRSPDRRPLIEERLSPPATELGDASATPQATTLRTKVDRRRPLDVVPGMRRILGARRSNQSPARSSISPQFKLIIAGNDEPGLRCVNEAIRRRLHLIPFAVTIPPEERDQLPERKTLGPEGYWDNGRTTKRIHWLPGPDYSALTTPLFSCRRATASGGAAGWL